MVQRAVDEGAGGGIRRVMPGNAPLPPIPDVPAPTEPTRRQEREARRAEVPPPNIAPGNQVRSAVPGSMPALVSAVDRVLDKQGATVPPLAQAIDNLLQADKDKTAGELSAALPGGGSARVVAGLASTAAPGTAPATEKTGLQASKAFFSPFRVPVWRKGKASLLGDTDVAKAAETLQVPKGRYILGFSIGALPIETAPFLSWSGKMPLTVEGRKVILEKAGFDKKAGRLQLQVKVEG